MQMLKVRQVIGLMVCFAFSRDVWGQSWIDPEDWASRWGVSHDSYLVKHFGELIVRSSLGHSTQRFTAEGVAAIVPGSSLEDLSSALSKALASSLAIQTTDAKSDVSLEMAWKAEAEDDSLTRMDHAHWKVQLNTLGIRLQPLRAVRLRTKPYNIVVKRGYSTATFLLFDGRDLFGKTCAVLIAYRTDRVRQWGWRSIHNIFSFGYETRTIDIVTNRDCCC